MIRFEEIDSGNWREDLQVAPEQKEYVADTTTILARAYGYRNEGSRAYLICDDDEYVGMILYYECEDLNAFIFSELLIDARYQRRGYGREASLMALEEMRKNGKYDQVYLCYIDGNEAARNMYLSLGFEHTGEDDDDEIVMRKKL